MEIKTHVPVIAFENLPVEKQVDMFVNINHKQKSVSQNLLTTLRQSFTGILQFIIMQYLLLCQNCCPNCQTTTLVLFTEYYFGESKKAANNITWTML